MKTLAITYQWIYIAIATILSTVILFYYSKSIPELISDDNLIKEILMCSGQLLWQGAILLCIMKRKTQVYLTNMITVSLLGSLMLTPLIVYNHYQPIEVTINVFIFLAIVCVMILEHARRVNKLRLPSYLTITWVVYRLLWLPILLF